MTTATAPDAFTRLLDTTSITFTGDGSDWSSMREAEAFLRAAGWSVGPTDRSHCRGVLFSTSAIAKWHTLNAEERAACDAVLVGDSRNGPLILQATDSGRARATVKVAVGGPDINDVYRIGYIASNDIEAEAQAYAQIEPYVGRQVVFTSVLAGLDDDWEDRDWFAPLPGQLIVASVDRLDVDGGFDGEVLYPDWPLTASKAHTMKNRAPQARHFRAEKLTVGDLHDLTFQPPGIGTREGHPRGVTLIEPPVAAAPGV